MLSLFAVLATASAANNAFTYPVTNITVNAGDSLDIKWANASGSTANILLRTGNASDLKTVDTVASQIANQGSYTWNIPNDTTTGIYALELTADGGENYSSLFTIIGDSSDATNNNATDSGNSTASGNSTTSGNNATDSTNSTTGSNSTAIGGNSSAGSNSTTIAGGANSTTIGGGAAGGAKSTSTKDSSKGSKTTSRSATGSSTARSSSGSGSAASASSSSSSGNAKSNGVVVTLSKAAVIGAIGVGASLLL